jgi:hypothetical protein
MLAFTHRHLDYTVDSKRCTTPCSISYITVASHPATACIYRTTKVGMRMLSSTRVSQQAEAVTGASEDGILGLFVYLYGPLCVIMMVLVAWSHISAIAS